MTSELHFDFQRLERIGFSEAVLCAGKSASQLDRILDEAKENASSILLTRLSQAQFRTIAAKYKAEFDFDEVSRTAFFGPPSPAKARERVAVITAGTSDLAVAAEASRTLLFHGETSALICDIGVAGLWRLDQYLDSLARFDVVIVVAGMDGALPSVIGGLLGCLIIAVPTSTGYGAAFGGQTALHAALTSCAPGVVVVNIDNGYGAAIAAMRAMRSINRDA